MKALVGEERQNAKLANDVVARLMFGWDSMVLSLMETFMNSLQDMSMEVP